MPLASAASPDCRRAKSCLLDTRAESLGHSVISRSPSTSAGIPPCPWLLPVSTIVPRPLSPPAISPPLPAESSAPSPGGASPTPPATDPLTNQAETLDNTHVYGFIYTGGVFDIGGNVKVYGANEVEFMERAAAIVTALEEIKTFDPTRDIDWHAYWSPDGVRMRLQVDLQEIWK